MNPGLPGPLAVVLSPEPLDAGPPLLPPCAGRTAGIQVPHTKQEVKKIFFKKKISCRSPRSRLLCCFFGGGKKEYLSPNSEKRVQNVKVCRMAGHGPLEF